MIASVGGGGVGRRMRQWLAGVGAVWLAVVLAGCDDDTTLPPLRPVTEIRGMAVDGPIAGASVYLYDWTTGSRGALLAQTTTDADGRFAIRVRTAARAGMIEIRGGEYQEEASGRNVPLQPGQVLSATVVLDSGTQRVVTVSPLSHIASALVQRYVDDGQPPAAAIAAAEQAVADFFGVRPTADTLLSPRQEGDGTLTPEHRYGFLLAALSDYTAWVAQRAGQPVHESLTSIALAQLFFQDVRSDGRLDGRVKGNGAGAAEPLRFGGETLSAITYRSDWLRHVLLVAYREDNASGIDPQRLAEQVQAWNRRSSPLFGEQASPPLDISGPVLETDIAFEQWYNGVLPLRFRVFDDAGVAAVLFAIDGQLVGQAADPAAPEFALDTTAYADGEHPLLVVATDTLGNFTSAAYTLFVDNAAPLVDLESPTIVDSPQYRARGRVSGEINGVASVVVNGVAAQIDAEQWEAEVTLLAGQNVLRITVTDTLGNQGVVERVVAVDSRPPRISPIEAQVLFAPVDGAVYAGLNSEAGASSDPIRVERRAAVIGDGVLTETLLQQQGIPYFGFFIADPAAAGVFTATPQLQVRYQYLRNGEVISSWQPLAAADDSLDADKFLLPLTEDLLGAAGLNSTPDDVHELTVEVEDLAGNITEQRFVFKINVQ